MKHYLYIISFILTLMAGCSDDKELSIPTPIQPGNDLFGVVSDTQGNRLQGVVVSDGYTCAVTDEHGVYQLRRGEFSYQVNVSLPAEYEVPIQDGLPRFWHQITEGRDRYDFVLTPLAGGAEQEFNLFCVADPQCQNTTNIARFRNESVPDIAAQVTASTLPCYGITLGDIGWNTENNDYTNDVFPLMKKAMHRDLMKLPLFQVIGNHDYKVIAVSKKDYTVAHDIAAQRNFEYLFGPINYSFNRGNVHIIAMDDIIFPNHKDYSLGFRDDQIEWLKQDLSHVSKDKMIIFCVHVPMRDNKAQNVDKVFELLRPYAEVHIMSGHTHYAENAVYDDRYEHIHGAASGAWWHSTINTDGTPNGYAVYTVKGASIEKWFYKSIGFDADYQIRLYRGQDSFMEGYSPLYKFYHHQENQIIANIWNYDRNWKVEVFENGTKTGEMKPFEGNITRRDAWASGYHCGVLKRAPQSYDRTSVSHLLYYDLQDPQAEVEVRATDQFGNIYRQSKFTTGLAVDFPAAE